MNHLGVVSDHNSHCDRVLSLIPVEFVADHNNKLVSRVVSALILELESRFHYYCFCSRLRRCILLN